MVEVEEGRERERILLVGVLEEGGETTRILRKKTIQSRAKMVEAAGKSERRAFSLSQRETKKEKKNGYEEIFLLPYGLA